MSGTEKNEPSLPNFDWTKFAPDFDLETESLGTIHCVRVLSVDALEDISKFLENESPDGPEFARELLRCVGKKHDNQNQDESEGAPLSDSDVQKVTDQEIEEFARQYVTGNYGLHLSLMPRTKSGVKPEGQEKSGSADSSSFEISKESGESDSGYLLRLFKLCAERQREDTKRLARKVEKIFPRSIYSNRTRELYENQMAASERLQDIVDPPGFRSVLDNITRLQARLNNLSNPPGLRSAISNINRLNARLNSLSNPPRVVMSEESPALISEKISPVDDPVPETPPVPRQIDSLQAAIVKTLVENAERADGLAEKQCEILAGSATLQESANNTLVSMQTDASKMHAKTSKKTLISISIAIATLVVTAGLQWWDNGQAVERDAQAVERDALIQTQIQTAAENQDKKLIDALAAFNAAQEAQDARLEKLTEALTEALRAAPDGGEGQQALPP